MVGVPLIEVIAERLKHYKPKYIVLDPVMVATSGSPLIAEHAEEALKDLLVPIATIITPNLPEGGASVVSPCLLRKRWRRWRRKLVKPMVRQYCSKVVIA